MLIFLCSLDSSNARAREGLDRVEKMGDTYDVEVDDMAPTDNEVRDITFLSYKSLQKNKMVLLRCHFSRKFYPFC